MCLGSQSRRQFHISGQDGEGEATEIALCSLAWNPQSHGRSQMLRARTTLMVRPRGQCIFICQPRNKERNTKGSLIDYEPHKIKRTVLLHDHCRAHSFMKCYGSAQYYRGLWMDIDCRPVELHLSFDANSLVTSPASTRRPEKTVHMIQMLALYWRHAVVRCMI